MPSRAEFTSPRVRGEVGALLRARVRGLLRESEPVEAPLTPTLSPQAGRGSKSAVPYAIALTYPLALHLADIVARGISCPRR
jgi:hypothetical protein